MAALYFFLLVFLVFLAFGRFQEALVLVLHRSMNLYRILAILIIILLPLSGRLMLPWKTRPGVLLAAFTVWAMLGIPFSIWRGGAYLHFKDQWIPALLIFAATGALVGSLEQMRRIMLTTGLSTMLLLVIYKRYAVVSNDGRLELAIPTIGNANDFALHILAGIPFLMFVFLDYRNKLIRTAAAVAGLVALYVGMQTGSRAGLLGAVTLLGAVFFTTSFTNKLKMAAAGSVMLIVLAALAPETATRRYKTILGGEDTVGEAVQSTESRLSVLKESIRQTIKRPIFGTGMGNFSVAYAAANPSGLFFVSHNTYTQVSSETGIPGFLFYMGMLVWCFRRVWALSRIPAQNREESSIRNMAYCLFLTLLGFCVMSIFGSNAYRFYIPLFAGMVVSLDRVAAPYVRAAVIAPPSPRSGFIRR